MIELGIATGFVKDELSALAEFARTHTRWILFGFQSGRVLRARRCPSRSRGWGALRPDARVQHDLGIAHRPVQGWCVPRRTRQPDACTGPAQQPRVHLD